MDGYLTQNQFRNTCQSESGISARTDWMVDFLTLVRNIAIDYKMVTENEAEREKCMIECKIIELSKTQMHTRNMKKESMPVLDFHRSNM